MKLVRFIPFCIFVAVLFVLSRPWGTVPALGGLLSPSVGFWQNAETLKPSFCANLPQGLLDNEGQIIWDDRLVPHVYAQSYRDAVTLQGFATAQLRLWQMEFQVYASSGRLSEFLGMGKDSAVYKFDLSNRQLGMNYAAELALELAMKDDSSKTVLEAYSKGVNAYIESLSSANLPLEYKILGYKPEPWTPLKTMMLMKFMAKTLVINESDLELTNAFKLLGKENFIKLFPEHFNTQTPIDNTNYPASTPLASRFPTDSLLQYIENEQYEHETVEGLGSNNWALSGQKTKSGSPILCNDPHLDLGLPSIWFEIHLVTPNANVYGASLPGAPGIIIGFNDDIAWGVTNVSHDVLDWYLIKWADKNRSKYWLNGQQKDVTYRLENVKVKGLPDRIDTIRMTHWGPMPHYNDPKHPKRNMAFKWLTHKAGQECRAIVKLNHAKNYTDYLSAIQFFECPAQNFVYADKKNNIAIWANGKMPKRAPQQGRFVQDGSNLANDWQGFVPHNQNPHELNPERGFVESANQQSTNSTYPHYYSGKFDNSRGRRIVQVLSENKKFDIADMINLQNDVHSLKANDVINALKSVVAKESKITTHPIYQALDSWDRNYRATAKEPVIFDLFMETINELVFEEFETLRLKKMPVKDPEFIALANLMNSDTANVIWDNTASEHKETATDIILIALNKTATKIEDWEKHNNTKLTYAQFYPHGVRHLVPAFTAFSHLNLPLSGNGSAPNAISTRQKNGRVTTAGPSWRMVIHLTNATEAYAVYPGGQSGNPGSPYYDNQLNTWQSGKLYKVQAPRNQTDLNKPLAQQTFKP